jgi:LmbE family N-acetylglucosaminyl deacetylase
MGGIQYNGQRVIVLAPHADDEIIGCGGVIQKYVRHKSQVRIIVASLVLGESERFNKAAESYGMYRGDVRLQEFKQAMDILKVADYHILYLEDASVNRYHSRLDSVSRAELVKRIEQHITEFRPTIIYVPSITKHQDHEALHHAAVTAIRPYFWNGTAFVYETDGELSFQPHYFVPLTRTEMAKKTAALKTYRTQLQPAPHPVSEEVLRSKAEFRGSQIFAEFAEAFQVLRIRG